MNKGVYARLGQIMSGYTNILPEEFTTEFSKLRTLKDDLEIPYSDIKLALSSIFKKDMKDIFDGFQTKPLGSGLFTQTHKAILL